MWELLQSRPVIAYAPQSTGTEDFGALPPAPPLPWLDDAPAPRPRPTRQLRSTSDEQLTGLAAAAAPSAFLLDDTAAFRQAPRKAPRSHANEGFPSLPAAHGVPWETFQSRARFDSAPRPETVDVLLALNTTPPVPGGWGPWLYSEPAFSRYTIVTLDQDQIAEFPRLTAIVIPFRLAPPYRTSAIADLSFATRVAVKADVSRSGRIAAVADVTTATRTGSITRLDS